MKFLTFMASFIFSINLLASYQDPVLEVALKAYSNSEEVQNKKFIMKKKGSDTKMCSFQKSQQTPTLTILSNHDLPGDRYVNILITERYVCNLFDANEADENSDIYTLTSIVSIHSYPKVNADSSVTTQNNTTVKVIETHSMNTDTLDSVN